MTPELAVCRWDEVALEKVTEMVTRKVIAGTAATMTQVYFKKGALVPLHAHDVEVIIYVLQGALRLAARERDYETIVREGEVIAVPAGLLYQVETLDDTFVLVVTSERMPAADRAPQRGA
jgi:quercetin dioxygenase-like cupin family protein